MVSGPLVMPFVLLAAIVTVLGLFQLKVPDVSVSNALLSIRLPPAFRLNVPSIVCCVFRYWLIVNCPVLLIIPPALLINLPTDKALVLDNVPLFTILMFGPKPLVRVAELWSVPLLVTRELLVKLLLLVIVTLLVQVPPLVKVASFTNVPSFVNVPLKIVNVP